MFDHNGPYNPMRREDYLQNQPHWVAYNADKQDSTSEVHQSWLGYAPGYSPDVLPLHVDDDKWSWRSQPPVLRAVIARLNGLSLLLRRLPSTLPFGSPSRRATLTGPSSHSASLPPEIASAATIRFILLCCLWYATSALSSNTGKSILTQFRYPVTLTFVQFGFVAGYCMLFMSPIVRFSRMRRPTKAILKDTFPMGIFQVGGHIFSSMAISRIPVSTVHTIKALSPLFTVAAYALLFGVSYSSKTYASLLPLTIGVMLACSFDMTASNVIGLSCAFGSAIVFVTSNIFFKKIMPSGNGAQSVHKLDKLNLLFYSSSMAFLLMIPIWVYSDLPALLAARQDPTYIAHPSHAHASAHSVAYYFITNGTVHFAQNIIAFVILASTSPVTYSIASLIKRVVVICIAIVWFAQSVHLIQAVGIALTFFGLWLYNNAKSDVEKGEKKMRRVEAARELALPSIQDEAGLMSDENGPLSSTPELRITSAYGRARPHPHTSNESVDVTLVAVPGPPRAQRKPPPPLTLTPAYSHTHTPPNLHIKITPPSAGPVSPRPGFGVSPVDSYPSPPPSLDSPRSSETHQHVAPRLGRRSTLPHSPPRQPFDLVAPRATTVMA